MFETICNKDEYKNKCFEKGKNYKFSDNFEEIGANAFRDYISLKEVTLPETVKKIGYCAFSSCYSLKKIKLSESLVEIGQYAFKGCEFEKIVIPRNVCKISPKTFVIGTNNFDIYFLSNKVVMQKKLLKDILVMN